jgi:protein-S-isoprenylcysteine O-methyltransferase Ste14
VRPAGGREAQPPRAEPASRTEDRSTAPALESHNMLPPRERRRSRIERLLVRLIATCGIVGIGVAIGAIMVSSKSAGWIVGLVVSVVSVVLAAILWSSRQL